MTVVNCHISYLFYTLEDQSTVSNCEIELFQTSVVAFTEYVQVKNGGGTCEETIVYASNSEIITFADN